MALGQVTFTSDVGTNLSTFVFVSFIYDTVACFINSLLVLLLTLEVYCTYINTSVASIWCFSIAPSHGGFLGGRGVGEGAESEEPAVSKGGKTPFFILLDNFGTCIPLH